MGQVVKLSDLMGTRFIINSLTQRFTNCMKSAEENGYTVDMCGCRFGPDCTSIMYNYYKTVDFCNSEDEYLDSVIKNNCTTARQQLEEYPKLDLKSVGSIKTFFDLVDSLDKDAKICPEVDLTSVQSKAILVMLIMARPDIEWDIRSCAADIFSFVRDLWISNAGHHTKYWELIAPNITMREEQESGLYGDRNYGFFKEREFIRLRQVLPVEFGTTNIIVLDEKTVVGDEWLDVVDKCINMFSIAEQSKRLPGKTVKDFLTFREDE